MSEPYKMISDEEFQKIRDEYADHIDREDFGACARLSIPVLFEVITKMRSEILRLKEEESRLRGILEKLGVSP